MEFLEVKMVRKNNAELTFYESLFIIIWFWAILCSVIIITFTIYSLITKQLYFVIFISMGCSLLVIALCRLLSTIFLKKITINENGIRITKRKNSQLYLWKDIQSISIDTEAIETGEFVTSLLFLLFKFKFSYLKITFALQQDIQPILLSKKQKQFINKWGYVSYYK